MIYIGLDVHKKNTKIAIFHTETDTMTKPYTKPTNQVADHLLSIPGEKKIALETSTTGHFLARQLKSSGLDVLLADARKTHLLLAGISNAKTDKLDAVGLCKLLRDGSLKYAQVWIPDEQTRKLRELTRTRKALTDIGVSLQNQIRHFLARNGADCPFTDLKGQGGAAWLEDYCRSLDPQLALALRCLITSLTLTAAQVADIDQAIRDAEEDNTAIQLLQTIPGIGTVIAATGVAEIGDISRFPDAAKLRGYTGLVPRVVQSGEMCRTGPLLKTGNSTLRWALILAAQNFASSAIVKDLKLIRSYRNKVYKYGPNPAKVDLARHLTDIIFAMLRDGTEFDPQRLADVA